MAKLQTSLISGMKVKMAEMRSEGKMLESRKTFKNKAGVRFDGGNKLTFSSSKLTFCLQIFPTVNRV